jgi:hypothetical protein
MVSRVKAFASSRRSWLVYALASALFLIAAPGAHAQTAATVDYGALATSAKTEIVSSITGASPVVFTIMAIIVGVGLTMAWVRRAAH